MEKVRRFLTNSLAGTVKFHVDPQYVIKICLADFEKYE